MAAQLELSCYGLNVLSPHPDPDAGWESRFLHLELAASRGLWHLAGSSHSFVSLFYYNIPCCIVPVIGVKSKSADPSPSVSETKASPDEAVLGSDSDQGGL